MSIGLIENDTGKKDFGAELTEETQTQSEELTQKIRATFRKQGRIAATIPLGQAGLWYFGRGISGDDHG
jgi:hypothetical protein